MVKLIFPSYCLAHPQEELDQRPEPAGGVPGEPAGTETRVSGPRQLVPEPSKWVGGAGDINVKASIIKVAKLDLTELQTLKS